MFIKTNDIELHDTPAPFFNSTLFWILLFSGFGLVTLPWLLIPLSSKMISKNLSPSQSRIFKPALKQLKLALNYAKAGKKNETYEIIETVLSNIVS